MGNQIKTEKVAYVIAKERVENISEKFQDVGLFDEDFFYENFFQREFPKDIVKEVLSRIERQGYVNAYMVTTCFNCKETVRKQEENFFRRETMKKINSGEEVVECPECSHSVNFFECDWKFAFTQEVLESGEEVSEEKGFLQKFRDAFRIFR